MMKEDDDSSTSDLHLELYKHLKGESSIYIQEIPKIWIQKFILIGGIIAFIFTNQNIPQAGSYLTALGIAAIPVLALLLDAKILEFGLHSRLISRFVSDTFKNDSALARWEELFWGLKGPKRDLMLARVRSFTTVIIVIVPTCVLIILSTAVLDRLYAMRFPVFISIGGIVCVVYLLVALYIWNLIWPKPKDS
ncbi:MAG TPA: hypothetical protein VE732_07425 [Nitrososphaera sp.]|jgi:hypothetical protein|nr:hypothetical protein [Nitrososphaera sp.]